MTKYLKLSFCLRKANSESGATPYLDNFINTKQEGQEFSTPRRLIDYFLDHPLSTRR